MAFRPGVNSGFLQRFRDQGAGYFLALCASELLLGKWIHNYTAHICTYVCKGSSDFLLKSIIPYYIYSYDSILFVPFSQIASKIYFNVKKSSSRWNEDLSSLYIDLKNRLHEDIHVWKICMHV